MEMVFLRRYLPFASCANLFLKDSLIAIQTWEACLRHLLASSSASLIDEVWSWEAVQHGDAALVNEKNLSGMCKAPRSTTSRSKANAFDLVDWQDNARDIAHFLLHYLPEDASSDGLPVHLHLLPKAISEHRKTKGFLSRLLVSIGHSFGGCSSCVFIATLATLNYR